MASWSSEKEIDKKLNELSEIKIDTDIEFIFEKISEIIRILPGMKSPTIVPLAMEGWRSLHSVINEDQFWDIIDNLKNAGAEGILVVPIEKMILWLVHMESLPAAGRDCMTIEKVNISTWK